MRCWRRSVLVSAALCVAGLLCCALVLRESSCMVSLPPLQPRAQVPLPPDVSHGNHSEGRRQLLGTLATPFYDHTPHTSFIRLEGVDSAGNDLFLVHGASVAQLKLVCASLDECEGFNSEGWIKSRVSGKKRAPIDLYLKQVARAKVMEDSPADTAAGIFADHMTEYNKMEQELRIYIYQTDIGRTIPSLQDYKYGVEYMFISLLAKSKFRTMNPDEATLFFIPSRCTAYRKTIHDLEQGITKAASLMHDMVNQIKSQFWYWNATLGADHFYICAHDMGTELSKLAPIELWKNAIALVNTADYSEEYFIGHKDISLPPHPGRGTIDWSVIGQGGATFDPYQRTKLAFMAGREDRGPVRPLIYQHYKGDPDFHLVKGYIGDEDYMSGLKTSTFCLCPRGLKAWSPRVMDALWFGCIPVLLSDHYVPPLHHLVQWDDISVTIPEHQVASLKIILQNISPQKIATLQHNILQMTHHLTWHDPPQPYDAFNGVMFELWQRRHVARVRPHPLHIR